MLECTSVFLRWAVMPTLRGWSRFALQASALSAPAMSSTLHPKPCTLDPRTMSAASRSSTPNPKPYTLNPGTVSAPAMSSTRLEAAQMAREAMPTVDASADDCMDLHPAT